MFLNSSYLHRPQYCSICSLKHLLSPLTDMFARVNKYIKVTWHIFWPLKGFITTSFTSRTAMVLTDNAIILTKVLQDT